MSTEESMAIVRTHAEALFNEKRLDQVEEFFAPDYIDHGALPRQAPGLEGAKQKWAMYVTAIPDMHATFDDVFAEGDKVAVHWTVEGTQRGELLGIPPTGNHVRFSGISIYRVTDGKIAEQWEKWDKLDLMQQLGVVPSSKSTEENKAAEARMTEEVWNQHDFGVVDELVAPDVVEHNPVLPRQGQGREGFRQSVESALAGFPDAKFANADLIAEGDKVVLRWTCSATHRGEFMGIPPTNRQVTVEGIDIYRYSGGQRVETWRQWDTLGLMRQLGVVAPPTQAGEPGHQ